MILCRVIVPNIAYLKDSYPLHDNNYLQSNTTKSSTTKIIAHAICKQSALKSTYTKPRKTGHHFSL